MKLKEQNYYYYYYYYYYFKFKDSSKSCFSCRFAAFQNKGSSVGGSVSLKLLVHYHVDNNIKTEVKSFCYEFILINNKI